VTTFATTQSTSYKYIYLKFFQLNSHVIKWPMWSHAAPLTCNQYNKNTIKLKKRQLQHQTKQIMVCLTMHTMDPQNQVNIKFNKVIGQNHGNR